MDKVVGWNIQLIGNKVVFNTIPNLCYVPPLSLDIHIIYSTPVVFWGSLDNIKCVWTVFKGPAVLGGVDRQPDGHSFGGVHNWVVFQLWIVKGRKLPGRLSRGNIVSQSQYTIIKVLIWEPPHKLGVFRGVLRDPEPVNPAGGCFLTGHITIAKTGVGNPDTTVVFACGLVGAVTPRPHTIVFLHITSALSIVIITARSIGGQQMSRLLSPHCW